MSKRQILIGLLLLFCVAGIAICYHLTTEHYTFLAGERPGNTYCNLSQRFNCDAVTLSPYSQIMGITHSAIGLAYFIWFFIAVFFAVAGRHATALHERQPLLLPIATLSIIGSLAFIFLSVFILQTICITCMTLHLVNFICYGLLLSLTGTNIWKIFTTLGHDFRKASPLRTGLWCVLGIVILGATVLWDLYLQNQALAAPLRNMATYTEMLNKQPVRQPDIEGAPQIAPKSPTAANAAATDKEVTIVEFSDFGCPFCRRAAFITKAVMLNHRNRVRLVFKNFPLDADCNPYAPQTVHPFACEVARGALCAQSQEKFWEYHDGVFSLLTPFTSKTSTEIAQKVGLDLQKFDACMHSSEPYRQLSRDIEEAHRLGVEATPVFFFNGRMMSGMLPAPVMEALIKEVAK